MDHWLLKLWVASCLTFWSSITLANCKDLTHYGHINSDSLLQSLATLSAAEMQGRKTGSIGAAKARDYIKHRYSTLGLSQFENIPSYEQSFRYPKANSKKQGVNLVGRSKGTEKPDAYIVITAHYDHLGKRGSRTFFGADDNASGVAAMLAIAENVAKFKSRHSILFVATDAEEKGLYGAKAFLREPPISVDSIVANINLDMLAEGGRRNRLYATFTRKHNALEKATEWVKDNAGLCFIKGHNRSRRSGGFSQKVNWRKASDHAAFAKYDIPYIFIGGGVHNRYHTPKDSFERISQTFYVAAAETAWMTLQAIDDW